MKKIIPTLSILTLSILSIMAHADYLVKIPLADTKAIQIKNIDNSTNPGDGSSEGSTDNPTDEDSGDDTNDDEYSCAGDATNYIEESLIRESQYSNFIETIKYNNGTVYNNSQTYTPTETRDGVYYDASNNKYEKGSLVNQYWENWDEFSGFRGHLIYEICKTDSATSNKVCTSDNNNNFEVTINYTMYGGTDNSAILESSKFGLARTEGRSYYYPPVSADGKYYQYSPGSAMTEPVYRIESSEYWDTTIVKTTKYEICRTSMEGEAE